MKKKVIIANLLRIVTLSICLTVLELAYSVVSAVFVIGSQIFDIVTATTFPEKIILEYIQSLISKQ